MKSAAGIFGSFLVFACVGVLVALGTWQVERMEWKRALLDHIQTHLSATPRLVPREFKNMKDYDFVRTVIRGYYMHDKEIVLGPRVFEGKMGYHIFTPLRRVSGPVVFVNRGWVPPEKVDPKTRLQGQVPGLVKVAGILRMPPVKKPAFVPENKALAGKWYWLDLAAMAQSAEIAPEKVMPLVLYEDDLPEIAWPVGNQLIVTLPNNHLYYAIFWYCMAFVLCVIYLRIYLEHRAETGARKKHR